MDAAPTVQELSRVIEWQQATIDVLIPALMYASRRLAQQGDGDALVEITAVMQEHGLRELAETAPSRTMSL